MRCTVFLLIAALVASVGAETATGKPTRTSLRVTADADGAGPERARTVRVRCRSAGDRSRGCRILRRLPEGAFAAPDPGAICTQVWGGPETARVTGRLRGNPVDLRYDRTDGCDIGRWDLAAPLLALTGVRAGNATLPG